MATCYSVFGLVLVVATVITAAVSNLTPFWIENEGNTTNMHAGLWQNCTGANCDWPQQTDVPKWLSAVRIVYTMAVANALVSLVISMSYLCCNCCRYAIKAAQFNILVLVVGCIETVGVVSTYAVKHSDISHIHDGPLKFHLGWSFYTAAASGVGFLLGIVCHVCETSNARRRVDYQPIRPTNVS